MRRITQWHVSRLHAAYERTQSILAAAKAVGVSAPTAYRVLAKFTQKQGYSARIQREAFDLYARPLSTTDVVRELAARHPGERIPSRQTVWEWLQKDGLARPKAQAQRVRMSRQTGKDYEAICREARYLAEEKLWSVKGIAEHLGVAKNVIVGALPRSLRLRPDEAIERRIWQAYLPDVEQRRARRDEVIARRERGETYPQIEAATGLSTSTVYTYLRQAGLTKPQKRRAIVSANLSETEEQERAA